MLVIDQEFFCCSYEIIELLTQLYHHKMQCIPAEARAYSQASDMYVNMCLQPLSVAPLQIQDVNSPEERLTATS